MAVRRNTDRRSRSRAGLTLLELMLALSLSGLLLFAIGMAIDLHLRTLDSRRNLIEQSIVARSCIRLIGADLRRAIVKYEQDMSSLEKMGAALGEQAAAALGEAAGGGAPGGGGGSPPSGGGGGAGGGGAGGGGAGGGGAGAAGGELGGAAGGDPAGEGETDPVDNTSNIADATTLPATPGLYGNQFELQIDTVRLPRFDELIQQQPQQVGEIVDIPSDVKSVAYYVQPQGSGGSGMGASSSFNDPTVTGGLVRRQLDRSVTEWAMQSGSQLSLQQEGKIIAPEVVSLQFRYYDGLEWLTEWDSSLKEGLPMAVEVLLMVRPVGPVRAPITAEPNAPQNTAIDINNPPPDVLVFRDVIRIPTAKPTFETEEDPTAGLGAAGL